MHGSNEVAPVSKYYLHNTVIIIIKFLLSVMHSEPLNWQAFVCKQTDEQIIPAKHPLVQ